MTFRDNDNLGINSNRKVHIQKYLFPVHKRYNFSQEPEKKRKENDALELFSIYTKGNSFIFNKANKNNFVFKKDKKKVINNNKEYHLNISGNNTINNSNRNIYSKSSIEKIKESVEKIIGSKSELKKYKNSVFLECKYKDGSNSVNFKLNFATNHKDLFTISPIFVKGNQNMFKIIIEKIKSKLM